ncbi:MAG: ATP-binding cassette domain-containing protein [Chloroflexia bacterium]|nr:ATP-binding cassette domain-containing protein [Chloroflexia bacterium]
MSHSSVTNDAPLLEVRNLVKHFPIGRTWGDALRRAAPRAIRAVDGISFSVDTGETLALVGESGCGKTTTGRCVLFLQQPTSGEVIVKGDLVDPADDAAMRQRRKQLQIVFQDPNSSLNPRMTIGQTLGEALVFHKMIESRQRELAVDELLETVGLSGRQSGRYPNELSGGQRQRVGIARALAVNPELIVADEPVSALDVSVRAQILQLLERLRDERGLAYLFISHDLGVVRHIADAVAVMYLGVIVERAPTAALYERPLHPYTRALLAAAPVPNPRLRRKRVPLLGDPPSPLAPPSGCRFRTRCPYAAERCASEVPSLRELETGHWVACHFAEDLRSDIRLTSKV